MFPSNGPCRDATRTLFGAPNGFRHLLGGGGQPGSYCPGSFMEIIPNMKQVLLNTLPFLVAILGMYTIILKPMLEYLLERTAAIKSGHDEAARIEKQIQDRMTDYEAKLAQAREEIAVLRAEKRADAQAKYDVAVAEARTDAEAKIEAALGEIGAAKDAASTQLQTMSGEIADQVAGQVLGRPLSAGA